jgi:hypothetical protein
MAKADITPSCKLAATPGVHPLPYTKKLKRCRVGGRKREEANMGGDGCGY